MADFKPFAAKMAGITNFEDLILPQREEDVTVHPPHFNHEFIEALGDKDFSRRSFMKWERIMHSHG